GGFSGKLLREKARTVQRTVLGENLPLEVVGVGGVSGFRDILDFWYDGGKVVQVYTTYIYHGPSLIRRTQRETLAFLKFNQLSSLEAFFNLPLSERQKLIKNYP